MLTPKQSENPAVPKSPSKREQKAYKEALNLVLGEHAKWVATNGTSGIRLELSDELLGTVSTGTTPTATQPDHCDKKETNFATPKTGTLPDSPPQRRSSDHAPDFSHIERVLTANREPLPSSRKPRNPEFPASPAIKDYSEALREVLLDHSRWKISNGKQGQRLILSAENLEGAQFLAVNFGDAEFIRCNFKDTAFRENPGFNDRLLLSAKQTSQYQWAEKERDRVIDSFKKR